MELFGVMFLFIWIVICAVVIVFRFQIRAVEATPLFQLYAALSLLLGMTLMILSILESFRQHGPEAGIMSIPLCIWYFLWSPISLLATFCTPSRFLLLPIGYIFLTAVFSACTGLLINDGDPPPIWSFIGVSITGFVLSIGAAATLFLAYANQSNSSSPISSGGEGDDDKQPPEQQGGI